MKAIKNYCILILFGIIVFSCSEEEMPREVTTYDIMLKETSFGKVLVDKDGMTLYFFANDVNGPSTCTGGCIASWPIFSQINPTMDPSLDAKKFGSIIRDDGTTQVTYNGWP